MEAELAALRRERADLNRELGRHHAQMRRLAACPAGNVTSATIADLLDRIQRGERRLPEIDAGLDRLERERVTEADVRAAFADFENVWGQLSPKEQARLVALLVARVEYDAGAGTVAVRFHATGIKGLSEGATLEETA